MLKSRDLLLFVFILLCALCSNFPVATDTSGSGSETTNAKLGLYGAFVDETGKYVEGASVKVYDVVDNAGRLAPDWIAEDSTLTDSAGAYIFDSLDAGVYNLEGKYAAPAETLFALIKNIDFDSVHDEGVDTLFRPGHIRGLVVHDDSSGVAGVLVYVPGSSHIAVSDESGGFLLSNVPPGTYSLSYMLTGYVASPDTGIIVIANDTAFVGPKMLEIDPASPPPPPLSLEAGYDADNGVVRLSWQRVPVSDLAGYIVYRNDTSTSIPAPLSGKVVADTFYVDTVASLLDSSQSIELFYRVKSQDTSANLSTNFSQTARVLAGLPDRPSNPVPANGAAGQNVDLTLSWTGVAADSGFVTIYTLYLGKDSSALSQYASGLTATSAFVNSLEANTTYYWFVTANTGKNVRQSMVWSFTTNSLALAYWNTFDSLGNMVMFGDPRPILSTITPDSTGTSFDNNGDANYFSGAILTDCVLDYSVGARVTADVRVSSAPEGCWLGTTVALTLANDTTQSKAHESAFSVDLEYVGDMCWGSQTNQMRKYGLRCFIMTEGDSTVHWVKFYTDGDLRHGWHKVQVDILADRTFQLWFDGELVWQPDEKLSDKYIGNMMWLGKNSSSYGDALIDNLRVYEEEQ